MVDTIVLGAGAVGVATAYYLNRAGESVCVVERQPAAAWKRVGATDASSMRARSSRGRSRECHARSSAGWERKMRPLLLRYSAIPRMWRWGIRFALNCTESRFRRHCETNLALALHSLRSLQEIRGELGLAYDASTNGVMKIYRSQSSLDAAERSLRRLEPFGLVFRRLTAAEAAAAEPALASAEGELIGAFHFPNDEIGDCNKFTQGLASECARRGVEFRYQTVATGIETDAGRVVGVTTDKGRIDRQARRRGARQLHAARCCAACGWMCRSIRSRASRSPFRAACGTAPRAWPVIDDSHLFGLVPIGDRVRVAGSAEITGYDTEPAEARWQAILANANRTFPDVEDRLPQGSSDLLGRAAAGDPGGNAAHRAHQGGRPVDQLRTRPSRLDDGLRIGTGAGRSHAWSRPANPLAGVARSDPAVNDHPPRLPRRGALTRSRRARPAPRRRARSLAADVEMGRGAHGPRTEGGEEHPMPFGVLDDHRGGGRRRDRPEDDDVGLDGAEVDLDAGEPGDALGEGAGVDVILGAVGRGCDRARRARRRRRCPPAAARRRTSGAPGWRDRSGRGCRRARCRSDSRAPSIARPRPCRRERRARPGSARRHRGVEQPRAVEIGGDAQLARLGADRHDIRLGKHDSAAAIVRVFHRHQRGRRERRCGLSA